MSGEETQPKATRWHVAQWPPLAWVETIIKLVALALGIIALVQALSGGTFAWPSGTRLAQLIILALLSLGLLAAILDRLAQREIVAMAFVPINNLGHWGMVYALLTMPGPGALLPAFAALMLAGDLVKLVFLRVSDFSVRDLPKAVLYGLTLVYVVGYLAILLLELWG
jgi:hypothetical protein